MQRYIVIPARLDSVRLPRKLLLDVCGKPLIWHTIQRALESNLADKIYVAADGLELFNIVAGFQSSRVTAIMTPKASSGTERIAALYSWFDDTDQIINLQGDEPLLPGKILDQMFAALGSNNIVTVAAPATAEEFISWNAVKVVMRHDGQALYFSRCSIPHLGANVAWRHIGVYAYCGRFCRGYSTMTKSTYQCENLEQLQWLQYGYRIKVLTPPEAKQSIGIDTAEDLAQLIQRISCQGT